MFNSLPPRHLDETYRGPKAALWLFGLVVGVRTLQSLVVIFNRYSTAINADPARELLPLLREHSHIGAMGKDGKIWFDPNNRPELLRK